MLVRGDGGKDFYFSAVGHCMKESKGTNIIVIGTKISIKDDFNRFFGFFRSLV